MPRHMWETTFNMACALPPIPPPPLATGLIPSCAQPCSQVSHFWRRAHRHREYGNCPEPPSRAQTWCFAAPTLKQAFGSSPPVFPGDAVDSRQVGTGGPLRRWASRTPPSNNNHPPTTPPLPQSPRHWQDERASMPPSSLSPPHIPSAPAGPGTASPLVFLPPPVSPKLFFPSSHGDLLK